MLLALRIDKTSFSTKVPSEDVAFDLLLQWLEGDHKNRSNYFLSLFKLIRLHFVSLKYLNEKIATHVSCSLYLMNNLIIFLQHFQPPSAS